MKNRIMLDTNVLVLMFISNGKCRQVVSDLMDNDENELCISEYIDAEFIDIIHRKWSKMADSIIDAYNIVELPVLKSSPKILVRTRDKKDDQVLSDAIYNKVDILITGDNDIKVKNGKYKVKIMSIFEIKLASDNKYLKSINKDMMTDKELFDKVNNSYKYSKFLPYDGKMLLKGIGSSIKKKKR